jgi:hypothetical protein
MSLCRLPHIKIVRLSVIFFSDIMHKCHYAEWNGFRIDVLKVELTESYKIFTSIIY